MTTIKESPASVSIMESVNQTGVALSEANSDKILATEKAEKDRLRLIFLETEKAKLSANFLNGIALSLIAFAVIGPVFKVFYSNDSISLTLVASTLAFLVVAILSHWLARRFLNNIPDPDRAQHT